jgi:hypothetical protein
VVVTAFADELQKLAATTAGRALAPRVAARAKPAAAPLTLPFGMKAVPGKGTVFENMMAKLKGNTAAGQEKQRQMQVEQLLKAMG